MSIDRRNPSHMKIWHTHTMFFFSVWDCFSRTEVLYKSQFNILQLCRESRPCHTTWQRTCPWHKSQKSVVSFYTQTPTTHSGPILEVQQVLAPVDCKCPAEAPEPNMMPVDFARASKAEGSKKRAKMAMGFRTQLCVLCHKKKKRVIITCATNTKVVMWMSLTTTKFCSLTNPISQNACAHWGKPLEPINSYSKIGASWHSSSKVQVMKNVADR